MATTTVQALKNADGNKIYPKTIADAVAYDSTRTVKGMLSNSVFCEHVKTVEDSDFPINATTLNGHTSDYFAKAEDIQSIIGTGAIAVVDEGIEDHDDDLDAHTAMFNDVTYYVDTTTGSNTNDGLSTSKAFRTIQAAIDAIPELAKIVTIVIGSGTYTENIVVRRRYNCRISFIGKEDDTTIINGGAIVETCNKVYFYKLNFIKDIADTIVYPDDPTQFSIKVYYSSFDVSKCTFNITKHDDIGSIGVYGVHSTGSIQYGTFNNYTFGIGVNFGYIGCYNIIGNNNNCSFYNDHGTITYDSTSNMKYTSTVANVNSGLILNQSTAQYLNMFSGATSENAASFHNSIYRGKDITSYLNDGTLFTRISSGTFDDLFIGDYFTMNITVEGYTVQCNKYVLCGFDTYLGTGPIDNEMIKHHAVVMPASILFTASMNDTDTTEGGYYNSKMHTTIMPKIATGIKTIIGEDHLIIYKDLLTNSITDGKSNGWSWYDTICRLCNDVDIYGSNIMGNFTDIGISNRQLPIFKLYQKFIRCDNGRLVWLSSIFDNKQFGIYHISGDINAYLASNNTEVGVRPRFLIG